MAVPPRKQTVLFVGDLSSVVTEQHIRDLFEVNGFMVVDIKMMGGKVTSNSFDYGFVELSTPEEAELALSTLDGTFLCGRRMRVKWAAPNIKNKPSKGIINSVHVRFQSLQPGLTVNEETLLSVFETFGIISDVSVKSCAMNPNNGLHDGYGFVHFPCSPEGVAVALKAVSALSENPIVDNVHYSCEMSKNLLKLLQVQSQKRSQDAYAALNSHLQYSSRYNTHNFQNYALPGQGYMPGSQAAYFRNNLRRPDIPMDRMYPGDYNFGYPQQPTQPAHLAARKPYDNSLSLMAPQLRPNELDEFPVAWPEQQAQVPPALTTQQHSVYEPAFSGALGGGLRLQQDPVYANSTRFQEPQLRYSDPRYPSDVRLMEHRNRQPNYMPAPAAPPGMPVQAGLPRRPSDPRDVRPLSAPAPIAAPVPATMPGGMSLGYGYAQPTVNASQHGSAQSVNPTSMSFRHEHGYTIEDFADYPYPQDEPEKRHESTNEDGNKSVDELNDLLSRHSISNTASSRIY